MRKLWLMQELISLLQGILERAVFTQFYLKENPKELTENTLAILPNIEKTLLTC